jgi:DNA invertase Pin-like site-specific DNA recombinase
MQTPHKYAILCYILTVNLTLIVLYPNKDKNYGQNLAYLRTSTDKQDLNNQKLEILEYARRHELKVDEFVEIAMSSRKTPKQRRIEELLTKLETADTLIISELSRVGRSTAEVIGLINELIARHIRIIIKQGLDIQKNHDLQSKVMITLFSLFAELERDLISLRTKEALAAKKSQGIRLGKPKGTIQASKFDKDREKIQELLALGLSVRKIVRYLGYTDPRGLTIYLNKRGLRPPVPPTA